MSDIPTDDNGRKVMAGLLDSDGATIAPIQCDATQHALDVSDDTTGSDNGNDSGNVSLDDNSAVVLAVLSSADDGEIVNLYVDSNKKLLINSN